MNIKDRPERMPTTAMQSPFSRLPAMPPQSDSLLKPIVTNPLSPYFSDIPLTSGDYQQRVKNSIRPPPTFWVRSKRPLVVGFALVSSTVLAVFLSNVLVTLRKEKEVEELLMERKHLRQVLDGMNGK